MFLFFGWDDVRYGDGGFRWMEMNKKSGGGDVRAEALSWDIEWEKAKNVFFGFFARRGFAMRNFRNSSDFDFSVFLHGKLLDFSKKFGHPRFFDKSCENP